jgi:hypothetical protein
MLFSTKNLCLKTGKLSLKFISLFKIIKYISNSIYYLDLLSQYKKLYPIFNVFLLKIYYLRKGYKPWNYLIKGFLDLEEDREQE